MWQECIPWMSGAVEISRDTWDTYIALGRVFCEGWVAVVLLSGFTTLNDYRELEINDISAIFLIFKMVLVFMSLAFGFFFVNVPKYKPFETHCITYFRLYLPNYREAIWKRWRGEFWQSMYVCFTVACKLLSWF